MGSSLIASKVHTHTYFPGECQSTLLGHCTLGRPKPKSENSETTTLSLLARKRMFMRSSILLAYTTYFKTALSTVSAEAAATVAAAATASVAAGRRRRRRRWRWQLRGFSHCRRWCVPSLFRRLWCRWFILNKLLLHTKKTMSAGSLPPHSQASKIHQQCVRRCPDCLGRHCRHVVE